QFGLYRLGGCSDRSSVLHISAAPAEPRLHRGASSSAGRTATRSRSVSKPVEGAGAVGRLAVPASGAGLRPRAGGRAAALRRPVQTCPAVDRDELGSTRLPATFPSAPNQQPSIVGCGRGTRVRIPNPVTLDIDAMDLRGAGCRWSMKMSPLTAT